MHIRYIFGCIGRIHTKCTCSIRHIAERSSVCNSSNSCTSNSYTVVKVLSLSVLYRPLCCLAAPLCKPILLVLRNRPRRSRRSAACAFCFYLFICIFSVNTALCHTHTANNTYVHVVKLFGDIYKTGTHFWEEIRNIFKFFECLVFPFVHISVESILVQWKSINAILADMSLHDFYPKKIVRKAV